MEEPKSIRLRGCLCMSVCVSCLLEANMTHTHTRHLGQFTPGKHSVAGAKLTCCSLAFRHRIGPCFQHTIHGLFNGTHTHTHTNIQQILWTALDTGTNPTKKWVQETRETLNLCTGIQRRRQRPLEGLFTRS